MLKLSPQCDGTWRWGLWEVTRSWRWSPHIEITALIRKYTRELSSFLPPTPSTWGHSMKASICKLGCGFSPGTELAGTLTLDLSASRAVRNNYSLPKPPSLWYFCFSSLIWWRHWAISSWSAYVHFLGQLSTNFHKPGVCVVSYFLSHPFFFPFLFLPSFLSSFCVAWFCLTH